MRSMMSNIIIIWLDSSLDPSTDDCQNILTQLSRFVSDVHIFDNPDECVDFLTNVHHEKVLMVIKNDTDQQIASIISQVPHLEGIYIYCDSKLYYEQRSTLPRKCYHVSLEMSNQSIFEILRQAIMQYHQNSIAISFIELNEIIDNSKLDELEPSFMYTKILKEILLDINYDQRSIDNVVNFLSPSTTLTEFIRDYHSQSAINWYTQEFIYGILNQSLRMLETDTILNIGFFIRDLHNEIEKLYREQIINYNKQSIMLYRGQGLATSDFEKLKATKGGLMAFNSFLSTTKDQDVAKCLADSNAMRNGMVGILFKITIDPSISSVSFAQISEQSKFNQEQEVLFSMHTVFRIGEIQPIDNDNRLYQVELTLTADNDEQLCILEEYIQRETANAIGLQKIGPILEKIGRYDKVVEWYQILAVSTPNQDHRLNFRINVAYAKNKLGEFDDALSIYQDVIQTYETYLSSNDPKWAMVYNNIGGVYYNKEDFSNALLFHKKALTIRQTILPHNDHALAESYNNIGAIYCKMGQYSDGIKYYEQGVEIFKSILPSNHPDLATLYNNIAALCNNFGDYTKALSYYNQALKIAQRSLPPCHPDLAQSHNNIGTAYQNLGQYSEALSSYQRGLEIRQQALPSSPSDVAQSYNNIGTVLARLGHYYKARSSYEEACRIFEQQPSSYQLNLSICYNNLGQICTELGEISTSLSFFEKALKIEEKLLPSHPSLATSYNNIGLLYYKMGNYSKALSFYEKALKIRREVLPSNHPDLAQSYNNIGGIYKQKNDYSKAFSLHESALRILEQVLPSVHPDLANTYANIGLLHRNTNNYSQAVIFYKKALDIFHKTLPTNHPLLANCYNNLGVAYYHQGKLSEALNFLQCAVDIFQMSLPWNHPQVQATQNNIENLKRELNRK